MNTVCELNRCSGCMACVDTCPKGAVKIIDTLTAYNAVISKEKCIECGLCSYICPSKIGLRDVVKIAKKKVNK